MESLLLILFIVFSVASALLERRKRAKQRQEAEQREEERRLRGDVEPAPQEVEVEEEEEEDWGGWPFPTGGDPFEPKPVARPQREQDAGQVEEAEAAPPMTADGLTLLEQLERQVQDSEQRARENEQRARERQQQIRPKRRVSALMREHMRATSDGSRRRRGGNSRWALTPQKARDAVVYAEILGPCKAEQEEDWRW